MKKDDKILLPESEDLVKEIHIPLFTSVDNDEYLNPTSKYRYFLTEKSAREHYCTHKKCKCGNVMEKHNFMCSECVVKRNDERYEKLSFREWDGKTPLVVFNDDTFFWDIDEIIDYCDSNDVDIKDLKLVYAEPNNLHEIETDYWEDIMPEDQNLEDIAPTIHEKLEELNQLIRKHKVVSWGESKVRTCVKLNKSS